MRTNAQNCAKRAKTTKAGNCPVVIDFGTRAISDQNFSKIVALPKQALANLGSKAERVNVQLVQEKDTKYIRLTTIEEVKLNE